MGKALLVAIAVFLVASVEGQISITVDPAVVTQSGSATSTDLKAHCTVTNHSIIPVNLLWSRRVVSAPGAWLNWICDKNLCYLPTVNVCPEANPNILDPGASMTLEIHIGPGGVSGEGEYVVRLFDMSDPETMLDSVDVVFETSITGVTDLSASGITIYPNPTTSYFQITNANAVDKVLIYNIVGSKLREMPAQNAAHYDVTDLPQGVYLVRMLDADRKVLKTVRLSKR